MPSTPEKEKVHFQDVYTYSDLKSKNRAHEESISNLKNSNLDGSGEHLCAHESQTADNAADSANSSVYSVKRGKDIRKCVQDAINSVGGIGRFVKKGDKVLVKINICRGVPERSGPFTSI